MKIEEMLQDYKDTHEIGRLDMFEELAYRYYQQAAETAALRARVEAQDWVIRRLEFIYADDVIDAYLCPICRGEKPTHYEDCELAAALK